MKRKMDCFRAHRLSRRLTLGGVLLVLLACSGEWTGIGGPLAAALAALAVPVFAAAGWVEIRYEICPGCGRHLFGWRRWSNRIPDYCPHCGERLIPSKE